MSLFGFDKIMSMFRIIKQNGGFIRSLFKMWRYETVKDGKLVGTDTFGNRYYQNDYYMIPRNRWVEIYDNCTWNYDASMITAEWFGWIHHKTDKVPCQDEAKKRLYCCQLSQRWLMPHACNETATNRAFYPYSTVPASINVWDG